MVVRCAFGDALELSGIVDEGDHAIECLEHARSVGLEKQVRAEGLFFRLNPSVLFRQVFRDALEESQQIGPLLEEARFGIMGL